MSIEINFWGTRGSFFKDGPDCHEFGGHTSCVSLHHGDDLFIIDAGSGLSNLGFYLEQMLSPQKFEEGVVGHFFLSHLHLDHICGFPSFHPIWDSRFEAHLYCGVGHEYGGLSSALTRFYSPPYFPVSWNDFSCHKYHYDFHIGSILHPTPNCSVETILLNHPGHGSGFAFHVGGRKIVYLCDTSHADGFFERFVIFAKEADLLIYDASYCKEQFDKIPHFGHSTWEKACELAEKADVSHLALTHHDFKKNDETLRQVESDARKRFPSVFAARCHQRLILG